MTRRWWATAGLVGALVLGPTACATPDLADTRARGLQEDVLAVTQASAQGRFEAADALLARLRDEVEEGRERGEMSAERYATLDAALDDVAAELAEASAARAAADAAAQAAAAQAAAEAAAAQATAEAQALAAQAQAEADAAAAKAMAEAEAARAAAERAAPKDEGPAATDEGPGKTGKGESKPRPPKGPGGP